MALLGLSARSPVTAIFVALLAIPVSAQESSDLQYTAGAPSFFDAADPDLVFRMRFGAQTQSDYFGSDNLSSGPDVAFRFEYVRFPNGFEYGSGNSVGFRTGWGLRGSSRFISERDPGEYPELSGLKKVDWSQEFGFGIGYEQENYRGFADVRYGIIGHHSFVGELGADLIAKPADGWTLTFGPRVTLGSNRFTDTYFGITADEAAASNYDEFDADAGVVEAGIEFSARYEFNERWGLEGIVKWNKYLGDAADSPIVRAGANDNLKIELGITRSLSFDF